jgi:hypothetical protein
MNALYVLPEGISPEAQDLVVKLLDIVTTQLDYISILLTGYPQDSDPEDSTK